MTISYVSENHTTQIYTGNPLVVTKPSGTIDGDLLIAIIGGTRSGGVPSGWTQLSTSTCGSSTGTVYVYYKIASSEGSSYSFPTGAQLALGSVLCYRGADTSTPVDGTNFSFVVDSGTDFSTSSVTADGTQWSVSFAMPYRTTASNATITAGSGSQRGSTYGSTATGENTSLAIFDSNGNVASGSTSRTQTVSSASAGCRGIFLINDAGISAPANAASSVTTTAYIASVRLMNTGVADVTTTAYAASVDVKSSADVADVVAAANGAVKSNPAGSIGVTTQAFAASVSLEALPHLAEASANAYVPVAYYGAPVVRVYFVPDENRTYIVRR